MTFSIVARSADGQALGVAVASKALAVGRYAPALAAGVGALSTQADVNLGFRTRGLALLQAGVPAHAVAAELMARDEGREHRQLGVVDATGGSATITGDECLSWAGGVSGPGYAIQGNILKGPEVVEAMEHAWIGGDGSFASCLVQALKSGDLAGGDSRGRQSAAVVVVRPGAGYLAADDIELDLRVDDAEAPVVELDRILRIHELTSTPPDEHDRIATTAQMRSQLEAFAQSSGCNDFHTWVGTNNYEMRVDPELKWVDRQLLEMAAIDH